MPHPNVHVTEGEGEGEGLGSYWSYAVLRDKVAQVFLSMNFNRGKRRVSLVLPVFSSASFSLYLYLSFPACVYSPALAIIQENSCR